MRATQVLHEETGAQECERHICRPEMLLNLIVGNLLVLLDPDQQKKNDLLHACRLGSIQKREHITLHIGDMRRAHQKHALDAIQHSRVSVRIGKIERDCLHIRSKPFPDSFRIDISRPHRTPRSLQPCNSLCPHVTQRPVTRIFSVNKCSLLRSIRGSCTLPKCASIFLSGSAFMCFLHKEG